MSSREPSYGCYYPALCSDSPYPCDNLFCPSPNRPLQQGHLDAKYLPSPPLSPLPYHGSFSKLGHFVGNRFKLLNQLGMGAYGIVYHAVDMNNGQQVAIKSLNRIGPNGNPIDHRSISFQAREIRTHWSVQEHPNVVSMYGVVDEVDCLYVILEYCREGDLFHNITDCDRYIHDNALAKQVFLQILHAVQHCHEMNVFHRDLKPENILVANQGHTVKLADFGLAIEESTSNDFGCGSTFYMSPECLDPTPQRDYSYSCAPNDVWSLGVVLVNLTCGRNPWKSASKNDPTYAAFLADPHFLKTILPITDELNTILTKVFESDPRKRITIPELIQEIRCCTRFTNTLEPSIDANMSTVSTVATSCDSDIFSRSCVVRAGTPEELFDSDPESDIWPTPESSDCGEDSFYHVSGPPSPAYSSDSGASSTDSVDSENEWGEDSISIQQDTMRACDKSTDAKASSQDNSLLSMKQSLCAQTSLFTDWTLLRCLSGHFGHRSTLS